MLGWTPWFSVTVLGHSWWLHPHYLNRWMPNFGTYRWATIQNIKAPCWFIVYWQSISLSYQLYHNFDRPWAPGEFLHPLSIRDWGGRQRHLRTQGVQGRTGKPLESLEDDFPAGKSPIQGIFCMGSMWILGCVLRHRFELIEVFVTYRASNSGLWLQPVKKKNISHLFQLCVYNCVYIYI